MRLLNHQISLFSANTIATMFSALIITFSIYWSQIRTESFCGDENNFVDHFKVIQAETLIKKKKKKKKKSILRVQVPLTLVDLFTNWTGIGFILLENFKCIALIKILYDVLTGLQL